MKYKFKKKITKVLAISMALSMILCTNAFATPIDLVNSTESVATDTLNKTEGTDYFDDEDTNVWANGQITERVDVTVQRESQFEITIPKDIVLDGETGTADYIVNAKGDIAGNQKLSVVPDAEFEMTEAGGKDSVTATVTQNDTEYTYQEMLNDGTDYPGSVAATLTAGEWEGKFAFNISFEGGSSQTVKTLNDYTWAEIAAISEAGEAANYFSIGDEKTVEIGEFSYYSSYDSDTNTLVTHPKTTYTLQVMGFNHDDLADGSGKAGMTLGLKEIMTTNAKMNDTETNVGGWEASKMRTYLQNDILPSLPQDLQDVIKTVNKKTSTGNMSTEIVTSKDKLFLFSEVEIFGTTTYSASGEGEQYRYYADGGSKVRNYLTGSSDNWWERSPSIPSVSDTNCFCRMRFDGSAFYAYAGGNYAMGSSGVVFGLSI